MSRLSLAVGLIFSGMIVFCGCATSPWLGPQGWTNPSFAKPGATPVSPTPSGVQKSPAAPTNTAANTQAMQEVMEELRQLGTLDPAAQNKLMEDLKQTDPALWPMVMQQFRAAVAYRRRIDERQALANKINLASNGNQAANGNQSTDGNQSTGANNQAVASKEAAAVKAATNTPPVENSPATDKHPADSQTAARLPDVRQTNGASNGVVNASYVTESSPEADWREHLLAAIKSMEGAEPGDDKSGEDLAQQARLRMLYVLANQRDKALKPIANAGPQMQDFWSKELYGLAMLLDSQKSADDTCRAAESKQVLGEALSCLGESASLVVRNLTFCTAVQSYGCYTPFKKNEFTPDQVVLLYAEMDNYGTESTAKGFHTALKSSYQIFDAGGNRVVEQTSTTTEEYCQNPRRDYFLIFNLPMPKHLNPGKYTLQLTIEDVKSKKVGQSSIEFTIKEPEK